MLKRLEINSPNSCLNRAADDEPICVLRGWDKDTPGLVEAWANQRECEGEDPGQVADMRHLAAQQREYRRAARGQDAEPVDTFWIPATPTMLEDAGFEVQITSMPLPDLPNMKVALAWVRSAEFPRPKGEGPWRLHMKSIDPQTFNGVAIWIAPPPAGQRPGTCRKCGCTELTPCVHPTFALAGCGWANRHKTLCTMCDEPDAKTMINVVEAIGPSRIPTEAEVNAWTMDERREIRGWVSYVLTAEAQSPGQVAMPPIPPKLVPFMNETLAAVPTKRFILDS